MLKAKLSNKKNIVPGSKVPVAYLIDYIKEGYTISEFITSYPWLKESSVKKALEEIKKREFTSRYAF